MKDQEFMNLAIKLAKKGVGKTNPNPLVGCVIAKNGKIISTGYHKIRGDNHAERNAILKANCNLKGATAYITLEPCCHFGLTPPCADLLIEAGITKVFVGSSDPNPLVAGKGIAKLKSAGITVIENFMKEKCDALNEIFLHYIKHKTPFVLMKYAMTADGNIASITNHSQWITSEKSRKKVQNTRKQFQSIMVGIGTVLADNPMLNCRIKNSRNPIRIICDSNLQIPLNSKIVQTAKNQRTIVATISSDQNKINDLQNHGVEILKVKNKNTQIDLKDLMQKLGAMEIDSILLEGGSKLNFSALQAKIVHKVHCYIAPKLLGGGKPAIVGIENVNNAVNLQLTKISKIDTDLLLEYRVK